MIQFVTALSVLAFTLFLILTIVNVVKKNEEKRNRYGLYTVISLVLIGILFPLNPTDEQAEEQVITEEEQTESIDINLENEPIETIDNDTEPVEEEAPLTLEEKIYESLIDTLGETNNMNKDRVVEFEVEGNYISVILNGSENLNANLTRIGLLRNSSELLEVLSEYSELEEFYVSWMLPLVDTYGSEEDEEVMRITMFRDELDKINWDNFDTENLSLVAEVYWEHPALRK